MKLVTTKFKSGRLHEKHVVATWNLGNHLSICFFGTGKPRKTCVEMAGRRTLLHTGITHRVPSVDTDIPNAPYRLWRNSHYNQHVLRWCWGSFSELMEKRAGIWIKLNWESSSSFPLFTRYSFQKELLLFKKNYYILVTTDHDMQCTYNMALRRVRATIVAVEKQRVLHILSVCL